jgi:hypothetical protein
VRVLLDVTSGGTLVEKDDIVRSKKSAKYNAETGNTAAKVRIETHTHALL